MKKLLSIGGLLAFVLTFSWSAPVRANTHWQIVQIYSNADGTVQFIELEDKSNGDNDVAGQTIATQSGHTFTFPSNIGVGGSGNLPTKNAHMLLGTPGYVARSGVPPADFNLGVNTFFSITGGDTITYSNGTATNVVTYKTGQLPLDDLRALDHAYNAAKPTSLTTKTNAPTNFAGETGIALEPGKFVEMSLGGVAFRNGQEDQANSTPQTIGSAYHYNFDISGHILGKGPLGSKVVPHGITVSDFFDVLEGGTGDALHGRVVINQFVDTYNLVTEHFGGTRPVIAFGHDTGVSVTIASDIASGVDNGLASFQCSNVTVSVNGSAESANYMVLAPDARLLGYNSDIIKSDFNVDGQSDLVLFKTATGQIEITELKNNKFLHGAQAASTFYALGKTAVPQGFTPIDVGEFGPLGPSNKVGDGYPDLLLVNNSGANPVAKVIYMKNLLALPNPPSGDLPTDAIPAGFAIGGIGDFDIDDYMDLLIYNPTTLATQIVYLKGVGYRGSARGNSSANGPALPSGYIVQGVSDFNDDGNPDLLLYNPTDNTTKCIFMNNAAQLGVTVNGPAIPEGFQLVGSGAFEANRHVDLVIYNPTSRVVEFIFLDGKTFTQTSIEKLGTFPKGIQIIGPK